MTLRAVTTIRRAVNVVVYVSDALRADHLGCYGARFLNTATIDELAAGGARFDQAISAAPWTAPSMTSMVTGLYPHHHGYLHWDATLAPSTETLFRALGAHGYDVGTFVFDVNFLFKGMAEANVLGTSETLDGAISWLRERRENPFLLFFHSWATHMPYTVLHSERTDWRAAKQEVIAGIQADSASALEATREAYRQAVERQSEALVASLLEELERLGSASRRSSRSSPITASPGGAVPGEGGGRGRVPHARRDTPRRGRAGAAVLSAPGRIEPAVVGSQVRSVDLVPTLLELAGLPSREIDGVSLLPLLDGSEDGDRPGGDRGHGPGARSQLAVRMPPWKLILDVESGEEEAYRLDVDPRERVSRPAEAPGELRELAFRELESAERRELTEEEEATVARRLADLGYL